MYAVLVLCMPLRIIALLKTVYSLTRISRFCFNTEHTGKLLIASSFQCVELYTEEVFFKGLTVCMQISRCVMKCCKLTKFQHAPAYLDDAAILLIGQDFNNNYKQTQLHEISFEQDSYSWPRGYKTFFMLN